MILLQLVVYGARGDAPLCQPGRKLGGVVRAQHAIARVKVAGHLVGVPQVVLQALERLCLAALCIECCLTWHTWTGSQLLGLLLEAKPVHNRFMLLTAMLSTAMQQLVVQCHDNAMYRAGHLS